MDFLRTLLLGDTRRWGAVQFKRYHQLLGHTNKIGIEIETPEIYLTDKILKSLTDNGFKMSWRTKMTKPGPKGLVEKVNKYVAEFTYLYDTCDPHILFSQVKESMALLAHYRIPKIGGLHVNVQIPMSWHENSLLRRKIPRYTDAVGAHSMWEFGDCSNKYLRMEFKTGCGFIHNHELIAQFLLFTHISKLPVEQPFVKKINDTLKSIGGVIAVDIEECARKSLDSMYYGG